MYFINSNIAESSKCGGDIQTIEKFKAFDLQFEFCLTEGANSGVKYGLGKNGPSIGLEFRFWSTTNMPIPTKELSGTAKWPRYTT
jgi:hypothetical protein